MKPFLTILLLGLSAILEAQNPIVRDQFTADPTARVFNNKIYLYPSHDIPAPDDYARKDWFCMADYHVFSSEDLTDWTDHGVILTQQQVPWGNPNGYSMWAPDCVYKDGKYYFYFPDAPREGRGFAIGVATADSPEGPFVCEPAPIKGIMGIDPCVLMLHSEAYIYWGGMGIRGAKLKSNMKEIDGESLVMEGLPEGFKEGPFAFSRDGWYYLTFPWVRQKGGTETLAYAMSHSPLGPWDFKGLIMAEHADSCWTNHHSIVEYQGQWYLFYHHNDYSPKFDKLRSARIERLYFNADGTIREVCPTLRGVGETPALSRIEIDRYSAASDDVTITLLDTTDTFRGWFATLPKKNSWMSYDDVSGIKEGYIVACVKADSNTSLTIREKSRKGKVIARLNINVQNGQGIYRRNMSGQWVTLTAPIEHVPTSGNTDLFVTCEGSAASIDWIQFKQRPKYFSEVAENATPSHPDSSGFIRRWMLLEPIRQDIRSNVVFTDSWLEDAFAKEYFKNQCNVLPKDGQKEKVGKQTLTWHSLESEHYNARLFRFAEQWGQQTYGSLFWGVTIINCDEEMPNVRLAAGSNGASKWWLNGEEVLLLSGDRRMVVDDGMSARLTLKKGQNVLRCAIINGPGLSDMCARFLDSNNQPITNLNIQ